MSTIEVKQEHQFTQQIAREKLSSFEEMMGNYGVSLDWKDNAAIIKGFGVSGNVNVLEDCVEIVLQLGMMAKAAGVDADRLHGSIAKRLAAAFAPDIDQG
jgi:putative polyhydroxyalkanoate system protein